MMPKNPEQQFKVVDLSDGIFIFNGDLLKEVRKSYGLTQVQLGKMLNKTHSTIAQWESGGGQINAGLPHMQTFRELCLVLNINPMDLMYLSQIPSQLIQAIEKFEKQMFDSYSAEDTKYTMACAAMDLFAVLKKQEKAKGRVKLV
jgi:transcriptional regulator with XRE-family HTH domain